MINGKPKPLLHICISFIGALLRALREWSAGEARLTTTKTTSTSSKATTTFQVTMTAVTSQKKCRTTHEDDIEISILNNDPDFWTKKTLVVWFLFNMGRPWKNLTWHFVSNCFPGISSYIESKKSLVKKSILHFSRWLCYQRSSLNRQSQKKCHVSLILASFWGLGWIYILYGTP